MNLNTEFLKQIKKIAQEYSWINIRLEINFTLSGGCGLKSSYLNEYNKREDLPISFRLLRPYLTDLIERFSVTKNTDNQFNQVVIFIDKKFKIDIDYFFNQDNILLQKLNSSKVFYQWLNETMMNRIFDYEKEKNLLSCIYNEDGEFDYYESSYDKGYFDFRVKGQKVLYGIKLTKEGINRALPIPLPEYIIQGILEHHNITNDELKNEWKPWNRLIIESPHNSIPYDTWEEYVKYSLEI